MECFEKLRCVSPKKYEALCVRNNKRYLIYTRFLLGVSSM